MRKKESREAKRTMRAYQRRIIVEVVALLVKDGQVLHMPKDRRCEVRRDLLRLLDVARVDEQAEGAVAMPPNVRIELLVEELEIVEA